MFYTLQNTLLQKFFRFFAMSLLQFEISLSELICNAASTQCGLIVSHQQLSSVLTSDKYFSDDEGSWFLQDVSKPLPNYTMSLPKESHFHFLAVGDNKFFNMKNSNFTQRRIF